MGNNLTRKVEFFPNITRGQLQLIESFEPSIRAITDIRLYECNPGESGKPTGLWEFAVDMGVRWPYSKAILFLSVDGKMVANCNKEPFGVAARRDEIQEYEGVGRMLHGWNNGFGLSKPDVDEIRERGGYMNMGRDYEWNVYNKVLAWAKDQIKNRAWIEGNCDVFGRSWRDWDLADRCPICGQPDIPSILNSMMCHHEQLDNETAEYLRKSFAKGEV